jgi:hypothetical protein
MRVLVAAAAIAALIGAGSAPALADMGGMVKQNGQCWKPAKTMDGGTFGYFAACPERLGGGRLGSAHADGA